MEFEKGVLKVELRCCWNPGTGPLENGAGDKSWGLRVVGGYVKKKRGNGEELRRGLLMMVVLEVVAEELEYKQRKRVAV